MKQHFFHMSCTSTSCFCWVLLLSGILLNGCNSNDLSDLNDLANANLQTTSYLIELDLDLTAEQVVSSSPVQNDNKAKANFVFDLASNAVAGQVNINKVDSNVIAVQICRGFGGQNGNPVAELFVTENPDVWRLADDVVLSDSDVDLLVRGGLYVQVATIKHVQGDLRSQLIIGTQELMVNPLAAEQVVTNSSSSVSIGTSYLTVDYLTGDVQGSIRLSEDLQAQQVELRQGVAGVEGETILAYEADNNEPGLWNIPHDTTLAAPLVEVLTTAGAYLQVSSQTYPQGELRGQVYPAYYYVDVVELSGLNLDPQVATQANGKVYLTLDGINGDVQAIVHLQDIALSNAIIYRINNPNNFSNKAPLFEFEQHQDYWQLPEGSVFENRDFVELGKGRLQLIVTSPDYPLGEIGGWL